MSDLAANLAEIRALCAPISATRQPRGANYSASGRELTGGRAIAAARNRATDGHGSLSAPRSKEIDHG